MSKKTVQSTTMRQEKESIWKRKTVLFLPKRPTGEYKFWIASIHRDSKAWQSKLSSKLNCEGNSRKERIIQSQIAIAPRIVP